MTAAPQKELLKRHGINYVDTKKGTYTTACPNCNGGYLKVKTDRNGATWFCHGCNWSGPNSREHNGDGSDLGPIKAVYDYTDEAGGRLFQVVLFRADGKVHRHCDIRREPGFEGWPQAHPILKDFLGVPIRSGDDVLGIIFLSNKRAPGGFTERDEELLTLFGAHAAIALTNARLYERHQELTVVQERNRLARTDSR